MRWMAWRAVSVKPYPQVVSMLSGTDSTKRCPMASAIYSWPTTRALHSLPTKFERKII